MNRPYSVLCFYSNKLPNQQVVTNCSYFYCTKVHREECVPKNGAPSLMTSWVIVSSQQFIVFLPKFSHPQIFLKNVIKKIDFLMKPHCKKQYQQNFRLDEPGLLDFMLSTKNNLGGIQKWRHTNLDNFKPPSTSLSHVG